MLPGTCEILDYALNYCSNCSFGKAVIQQFICFNEINNFGGAKYSNEPMIDPKGICYGTEVWFKRILMIETI